MAITSELLGKLGGADVEVTPVEASNSGRRGSEIILHTVEVPEGESWLIMAIGDLNPAASTSANGAADLMLGSIKTNRYRTQARMTVAGVHTETVEVKLVKNVAGGTDTFTGHVYTVKL